MPVRNVPIDIIAYGSDASVVLLAEASGVCGSSEDWAAQYRRNMLEHRVLPPSRYFLIATPEKLYLWKQEGSFAPDDPPHFTIDAREALGPYFERSGLDPARAYRGVFEFLIFSWLADLINSLDRHAHLDPSLRPLSESGLLSALGRAELDLTSAR